MVSETSVHGWLALQQGWKQDYHGRVEHIGTQVLVPWSREVEEEKGRGQGKDTFQNNILLN